MTLKKPAIDSIISELKLTSSRSSGPGGQSVNKVNTKITLRWDVLNSGAINEDQRALILSKLNKIINIEGEVIISADDSRSQIQNKEEAINKLNIALTKAFHVVKSRKPTKPTKASIRKRLDNKKKHSIKKKVRKDPE